MCQPNRDSHPSFHGVRARSRVRQHRNKIPRAAFPLQGRHPPFKTAPVADSQRSSDPLFKTSARADSQRCRSQLHQALEVADLSTDIPQPNTQPGMAARAIDAAADVSRTIGEVAGGLRAAVDRLTSTVEEARKPGRPLATVAAITREAPLASLFVAFLFGVAVARRR